MRGCVDDRSGAMRDTSGLDWTRRIRSLRAFQSMGWVSESCDEEAWDWKDLQFCDQLCQRTCVRNPCRLHLSLLPTTLVPRVSGLASDPYPDAMVRAFLESHIPMIVAGSRDSPAWNLASIRTGQRGHMRGRCAGRPCEFRDSGRLGGETTARIVIPTSVLFGCMGPATHDAEDPGCLAAGPEAEKHVFGLKEVEDARRAIVKPRKQLGHPSGLSLRVLLAKRGTVDSATRRTVTWQRVRQMPTYTWSRERVSEAAWWWTKGAPRRWW